MVTIKAGKTCLETGVYKCPACDMQISMAKGEIMLLCDKCGTVVWELVLRA